MKVFHFKCGCEYPVLGPPVLEGGIPKLDFNINEVRLDCPAVWDYLGTGQTKGIFQLESNLGRHWTKEIAPRNISDLSAIISLVRPGCLKSKDSDGKSMTQHYADRKNGKEPIPPYHPAIDKVLEEDNMIIVYQEQSMKLCQVVAGFDLQEADMLRKAIGKKLPEEMAKVKKLYLERAANLKVVSQEQATQIFDWIEKSQRYQFNKSHAVSYAMLGYWSAYMKVHFPLYFYMQWLRLAKDKIDPREEIRELVNDAKISNISILPPKFSDLQPTFYIDGKDVRFGVGDIKSIGEAALEKLQFIVKNEVEQKIGPAAGWSWYQFLTEFSRRVSKTVIKNLIGSGALSGFGVPRARQIYEFDKWLELTDKEQDWIIAQTGFTSLIDALKACAKPKKEGGGCSNVKRVAIMLDIIKALENPPVVLEDRADHAAHVEEQLLGCSLSYSQIDVCDTRRANFTCKDFVDGRTSDYMIFGVELLRVQEYKTKGGKNPGQKMAFLSIKDQSCTIDDCVMFGEAYEEFGVDMVPGNTVLLQGEKDQKRGSLIAQKVWPL